MPQINPLLPIKRVIATKKDYKPNLPGGSDFVEPLVDVDDVFVNQRIEEIDRVDDELSKSIESWKRVPTVGIVKLHNKALAKTKRPFGIFNNNTCPIIGGRGLGELLFSVTPKSLKRLRDAIESATSEKDIAQLSTIESIRPHTKEDVLGGKSKKAIDRYSKSRHMRLVLFRHLHSKYNAAIQDSLTFLQKSAKCKLKRIRYASGLDVFECSPVSPAMIAKVASFPGARDLQPFPQYHVMRTESQILGSLPSHKLPGPKQNVDYPLVGLIDTGTDPDNALIQAWVTDRWDAVPGDQQDNNHGNFVGGLICAGRTLNHGDERFPSVSAKIVDVVAFDRSGTADEMHLLRVIRRAVTKYPRVMVWNLSFSVTDTPCRDDEFSPFGLALSDISEEHAVQFVIAAGNSATLRGWPRTVDNDEDRICSPADSPTSIVVGAIAHRDSQNACVRENQASPFTRHGPGVAYLLAPHISHIGGNCDKEGRSTQMGVISVDGQENLAEDIGTSFAAPPISLLFSSVCHEVLNETRPDILGKALLLHSTLLNNTEFSADQLNHTGFGLPPDAEEITHCRQSSATIVFEVDLANAPNFVKEHFPMPKCLVTSGSLSAEIIMSLVYSPPLDPNSGFECCQTNVKASLGTLHPNTGKFGYAIKPFPQMPDGRFEKDLVIHGYKWSPYKFYRRKFSRKNTLGNRQWELRLNIERRSMLDQVPEKHIAYVLVTIRSHGHSGERLQVYDQLVVEMDRLGWGATDLQVRTRTRTRTKS